MNAYEIKSSPAHLVTEPIIIDRRFCGPPDSGNGGYVCGILSRYIPGDAEVKLLRPIPLEKPLRVDIRDEGRAVLLDGGEVVAAAGPAGNGAGGIPEDLPRPPGFDEADRAVRHYIGFHEHPFPTCFVCGPHRTEGDGLRIFAGTPEGRGIVAASWLPDATLTDGDGFIRDEFIWAALDCPGAFAVAGDRMPPIVLGTLAVRVWNRIRAGEKAVVVGWKRGGEGRKAFAGTAVFSESGQLCATGRATWIWLRVP